MVKRCSPVEVVGTQLDSCQVHKTIPTTTSVERSPQETNTWEEKGIRINIAAAVDKTDIPKSSGEEDRPYHGTQDCLEQAEQTFIADR